MDAKLQSFCWTVYRCRTVFWPLLASIRKTSKNGLSAFLHHSCFIQRPIPSKKAIGLFFLPSFFRIKVLSKLAMPPVAMKFTTLGSFPLGLMNLVEFLDSFQLKWIIAVHYPGISQQSNKILFILVLSVIFVYNQQWILTVMVDRRKAYTDVIVSHVFLQYFEKTIFKQFIYEYLFGFLRKYQRPPHQ